MRAKAPRYLGFAKNIIDTAGLIYSWQVPNSEVLKIRGINDLFNSAASTPAVRHRSEIAVFIENLAMRF
uniref:Uncharacterized protein n=1 Tax=Nostoc flagelliforme str. Sunitezuoqi TaxID=676037 RepID=E7DQ22_9NOSO|nr:hypothetical protein Nfla_6501 [Nostoc flagelliforme str. Sunitezuoqi]